ncbi:MAG: secondary thiamine-phosphate synthase enzyme YjbQ [Spirochaetales bacterium]
MTVQRTSITIAGKPRGCHLITSEIQNALDELETPATGLAHIFLKHTSASLSINENASPDVRSDMEEILNHLVPENEPYYDHTLEGADDMPAHGKSSLFGVSLTIPVHRGRLSLGTWQGVYLCEHRNRGGSRSIVITVIGE